MELMIRCSAMDGKTARVIYVGRGVFRLGLMRVLDSAASFLVRL